MTASVPHVCAGKLSVEPSELDAFCDLIAARVVERVVAALSAGLTPNGASVRAGGLVDAQAVADALSVDRRTVYQHRDALGAIRVGDGERPRLRFDLENALQAWGSRDGSGISQPVSSPPLLANRAGRSSAAGSTAELLPVGRRKRGQ